MKYYLTILMVLTFCLTQCQNEPSEESVTTVAEVTEYNDGHLNKRWVKKMYVSDSSGYQILTTTHVNYSLAIDRYSRQQKDQFINYIDSTFTEIATKLYPEFSYYEIYNSKRAVIENELQMRLTNPLENNNINLNYVVLKKLDFPEYLVKLILEKEEKNAR